MIHPNSINQPLQCACASLELDPWKLSGTPTESPLPRYLDEKIDTVPTARQTVLVSEDHEADERPSQSSRLAKLDKSIEVLYGWKDCHPNVEEELCMGKRHKSGAVMNAHSPVVESLLHLQDARCGNSTPKHEVLCLKYCCG